MDQTNEKSKLREGRAGVSWGWLLLGLLLLGLALWLAFAKSKAEFLRAAPGVNGVQMKLNNE